jgi:glycosyltransferase 2 family protein
VASPEIVKKATASNSSRWRGYLHRLLPLVVGLGLLALILSRTDLARLGAVLARVHWQWYALAQLVLLTNLLFITSRWRFNLGLLNLRYPFGELFLIDNAGALAGAATPGRMGDLARLIYFRQDKHLLLRIGLSILVERFLDLTVLVWLCAGYLWIFPLPVEFKRLVVHLFLAATLVGLGIIVITWRVWGWEWLNTKVLRFIPRNLTERFSGSAQELKAALRNYRTWRLVWPITLTFLAWGLNILAAHLSARSLLLPLSLWQTGACFCLSTLFTLIPLSVAGIGTRELAMVFLFSYLGLPSESALAFSFLLLGFLLTHSLVGFMALLIKPPRTQQDKKQQAVSV